MINDLLTVKHVAELMKTTRQYVYAEIHRGKLVALVIDKVFFIDKYVLDRYLQKKRERKLK